MKFAHILSRVTGTPWFITADALAGLTSLLEARMDGLALAPMEGAEKEKHDPLHAPKGTAVIPVFGVVGKRLDPMEMACGGADIDAVAAAFHAANRDPDIERIALHFDSPGGTVTGVPELAAHIYQTKRKPVMAVTDTLMASAAYYLASAADEIVATPTATVGSIGVTLQVRETVKAEEGSRRLRVFRSGADKALGLDGPLTEAQAAKLQGTVDFLGDMFCRDVVARRSRVAAESMTGWAYFGQDAQRRGLVDRVVRTLDEALG